MLPDFRFLTRFPFERLYANWPQLQHLIERKEILKRVKRKSRFVSSDTQLEFERIKKLIKTPRRYLQSLYMPTHAIFPLILWSH
jgi:hypothetical protein